ncbi:MAG: hypothetical protein WBE92_18110 [Steroidobacteraceae bacterium]
MIEIVLDRLPGVLARRGDGRSSLYSDIAEGLWTPPIRMGRASTWPAHETQAILAAHVAGATDDEIRQLVRDLLTRRKSLMPRIGPETEAA